MFLSRSRDLSLDFRCNTYTKNEEFLDFSKQSAVPQSVNKVSSILIMFPSEPDIANLDWNFSAQPHSSQPFATDTSLV